MIADWPLREYLATIERREQAAEATAPAIEFAVADAGIGSFTPRFTPRRVPRDLMEQVSPLEWRKVRVLHSVNVTNLSFGHRRLTAGTEMSVPAPAAFAMVYARVAEYLGEPAIASVA